MPQLKKGVPLFHSITTPIKMPSQQGRSTSIHSTGKDCMVGKCSAARWGAERPVKNGVPENNIPGPRRTPPGFRTADDAANPSDPFGPQWGGTSRAWDIILWHPTLRGPLGSPPCSTARWGNAVLHGG